LALGTAILEEMRRGLVRSAAPVDPSWSATTIAILSLAIGCGQIRTIAESDGTSGGDAGEAVAAARDASEAVDAPDAPETSLPDARPDVGPCPSDVIFMAVQADDVNSTTTLQTFAPATGVVTKLGPIACANGSASVASLAVDQTGTVYIYNWAPELQRLDTTTFACEPGPPSAGQPLLPHANGNPAPTGYQPIGIAFVGDGTRDVLYANFFGVSTLATIDLDSGAVQATPDDFHGQLAGTSDGRLFVSTFGTGAKTVVELEPTTGAVVQSYLVQPSPDSGAFFTENSPIAVGNGEIYTFPLGFFADAGTTSEIARFRPSDGSQTTLATITGAVVGASAATCLPSP
jgi:outer membrane protein assembly factor BamB